MGKSKLKSKNCQLQVLLQSPGIEHLEINGCRLSTHEQVFLCYISTMSLKRSEDTTKNQSLKSYVQQIVAKKVIKNYEKGGIEHKPEKLMCLDIKNLNEKHIFINKKKNKARITTFIQKL